MPWYNVSAGQVVTHSHMNLSLDQGITVFATATERDNAIKSPKVGMHTFLVDVKGQEYWDGGKWVPIRAALTLDELTDVDTSTVPATAGDTIVYDGVGTWTPGVPISQGVTVMEPVAVATLVPITLSGLIQVDGVFVVEGDRVLVKEQADKVENGLYVAHAGAWTRAPDADAEGDLVPGSAVFVEGGLRYGNISFLCGIPSASIPWTPGVDPTVWMIFTSKFDIQPGAGLTMNGRIINVGQGQGIIVSADTVAVDMATVASKPYVDSKYTIGLSSAAPVAGGLPDGSLYFGHL
jgi:hypothetical protein